MKKTIKKGFEKNRIVDLTSLTGGQNSTQTGDNEYTAVNGQSDCGDVQSATVISRDVVFTSNNFDSK